MTATQAAPSLKTLRTDLRVFAEAVGTPLTDQQVQAASSDAKVTCIVGARQSGKTRLVSVRATWQALRQPGSRTLIVSASEDSAKRVLADIRRICQHELLKASVVDEQTGLLTLTNGSEIRSTAASEKAIRGWSVDLAIVDEAALVSDELIEGAVMPTISATHGTLILASSPFVAEGAFYRFALLGEDGSNPNVTTHRLALADSPWISREMVELARETLPEERFRSEFLGEWTSSVGAYFDVQSILQCVAPYRLLHPRDARGESITVGLDWGGGGADYHAIATIGLLADWEQNGAPVLYVPWIERARRPFSEQLQAVVDLDDRWGRNGFQVVRYTSEQNGVGTSVTEDLVSIFGPSRVTGQFTTQRSKETQFGQLRKWISDRRLILPAEPDLLRELRGLRYVATPNGGYSISAASPSIHDDLSMALALAASAVPARLSGDMPPPPLGTIEWIETPGGVVIPKEPRPQYNALHSGAGVFTRR